MTKDDDYRFKAIKESAEFLYQYKIPTTFLIKLINSAFDAKREICEKLDLIEKYNYRTLVDYHKSIGENTIFTKFMKAVCEFKSSPGNIWTPIDTMYLQDGKKNKYKITRIMDAKSWMDMYRGKYYDIVMTIGKESGLMEHCFDCEWERDRTEGFATNFPKWYGDHIKDERIIVLSANPLDLLRASSNASFQSCYRPDGEQFNGIISNMLSKDVIIATVEDPKNPGYKIGRSWVYLNDTMVLPARKYGSITDEHHLAIRNFIQGKFGGDWKLTDHGVGAESVHMDGPGYVDNGTGRLAIRKDLTLTKIRKAYIPKALCLYCGKEHKEYSRQGICKSCSTIDFSKQLD